jgi:hypothetical protein
MTSERDIAIDYPFNSSQPDGVIDASMIVASGLEMCCGRKKT